MIVFRQVRALPSSQPTEVLLCKTVDIRKQTSMKEHTHSSLLDLFRNDPEDLKNLNHNLNDDVRHSRRRPDLDICLETLKKVFDATKDPYKSSLASADTLSSLGDIDVTKIHMPGQKKISSGGERQSQQKSHLRAGISVMTPIRRRSRNRP